MAADLADFDRALQELGESGPVYAFERGEDGKITFHLPSKTVTWLGAPPSPLTPNSSPLTPNSADFTAISGINAEIATALHNAGFHTFDDLVRASDPALLDIAGIGPATLRRIRAYLKDHYL
jgi:hypothetical protein